MNYIASTYSQAFKLFTNSFVAILPFAVVYIIIDISLEALVSMILPKIDNSYADQLSMVYLLIIALISIWIFSCILLGMYQKHHQLPFRYTSICLISIQKFLKLVVAIIIILLPIILMSLILHFISGIFETLAQPDDHELNLMTLMMIIFLALFSISMIAWFLICIFFYVTPLLILIKNEKVIDSIKHSRKLIKDFWCNTLLLLFLFVFVTALLQIALFLVIGPLSEVLISIYMLPFSAALMIAHHDKLEKIKEI